MTQALAETTGRPVDLIDLASVSAPLLSQIVQHGRRVQGSVAESLRRCLQRIEAKCPAQAEALLTDAH